MNSIKNRINYYFLTAFFFLLIFSKISVAQSSLPLSPSAMCIAEKHDILVVAQQTEKRIDIINLESEEVIKSIGLSDPPKALAYNGNDLVYIAASHSSGKIYVVDIAKKKLTKTIEVGYGACSLVLSPDKNTLYVGNQFSDDVSIVDLQLSKEIDRIEVLRQPKALDISPDGRHLFVANFLPETRADLDSVTSKVSVIDTKTKKIVATVGLANGSNALHGIKVSPDGKYVFISHNLGRFQFPTSQLEQGWMNTSALSVINARSFEYVATVLLDEAGNGAANPWDLEMNDKFLFIAHSGTHEISVINYPGFISKLEKTEQKKNLSYRLDFLLDLRKRIPVFGQGPRALFLSNSTLYAGLYFSDAIQKMQVDKELDNITSSEADLIQLNPDLHIDSVRLGEMLFHDARHCFEQWQSCASCHPDNARVDGLNWDLLNDGIGNPKNCKSLLLSHQTPPSMITGVRPTAESAVRAGFKHIQFAQVDDKISHAVDLYLQSLEPVPSPYLENGILNEKAQKGKEIYNRVGCADCHPAPFFTDMKMYSIGEKSDYDNQNTWDTPTLVEIWRTAPYLHDGSCETLYEVLNDKKHGLRESLSQQETDYLVSYLLTL